MIKKIMKSWSDLRIVTGNGFFLYENPRQRTEGGKALIEDQRMYPQPEILKIYTTEIFDIQFKITCCVLRKKFLETDPCLEIILVKFLNALEKQKILPISQLEISNIAYKGKRIRLALSPLLDILNIRRQKHVPRILREKN